MNKPKFEWLPEEGTAICTLKNPTTNKEYIGIASCHDDDLDMCSEKVGCEIALRRATIEVYKDMRDIRKAELQALKQLFYSINMSKKYNAHSYEARMLKRQIKIKESDLALAKELLEEERKNLKEYLDSKDLMYQSIRARRNKGQD